MPDKFYPNARVRIIAPDSQLRGSLGTVYNYLPSRPCPWHVRPDEWDGYGNGVAFKEDELELVEQEHVA